MNISKILIIRFSSIGDIILASHLTRCVRLAYPDAQIDFLLRKDFAELVKYNPHISNVIEFDTSTNFKALRKLANRIKEEKYDTVIDIHNSLRSRFIRLTSGSEYKFSIKKRTIARFCLINFHWNFYNTVVPNAQKYLECALSLSVKDDGKGLDIFISDEINSKVSDKLNGLQLNKYKVIIGAAPSAKHNTKKWLADRYIKLFVRMINEHHAFVMVFGGKGDKFETDQIVFSINEIVGRKAAINFAGEFSLLENAAAFDSCNVVVTNDTGLMHLASARKRKVVAIFGPTVKEFGFFPFRIENIVVERNNLNCRPCTHIGSEECPKKHFKCMKDVSTDYVYKSVLNILNIKTN
jgi:lipopolysaccharide heptosyltransferase II